MPAGGEDTVVSLFLTSRKVINGPLAAAAFGGGGVAIASGSNSPASRGPMRGLTVAGVARGDDTVVSFPDDQSIRIRDTDPDEITPGDFLIRGRPASGRLRPRPRPFTSVAEAGHCPRSPR